MKCIKFVIFLLLSYPLTSPVMAQVVTVSFDPTRSVVMAAAAGRREQSMAGFSYYERSGERRYEGKDSYKFETSGYTGNAAFQMGNISADLFYSSYTTDVSLTQRQDGEIDLGRSQSGVNIAIVGNENVTVGLGMRTIESNSYVDATRDSEVTTRSGYGGSVSIRTMDIFYLGGGVERVNERSTFRVNNLWNQITAAVALQLGEPGETRFRLELSGSNAPRVKSEAEGDLNENIHPETSTSRYEAELMFSGLLFAFRGEETKEKLEHKVTVDGREYGEIKRTKAQTGVLWVPKNGLTLGFYIGGDKVEYFFTDEHSEFRVNVAYVF